MIACDTLPVVPSGVITWTQTGTVASKFGSYARVVSPVSSVSSSAGSRDSPPRAVENPGAAIWLRLLKLLYSAELHSHDVWRLGPAAVAVETWSAAIAAVARTASSDSAPRSSSVHPTPPLLAYAYRSVPAQGEISISGRDRVPR